MQIKRYVIDTYVVALFLVKQGNGRYALGSSVPLPPKVLNEEGTAHAAIEFGEIRSFFYDLSSLSCLDRVR